MKKGALYLVIVIMMLFIFIGCSNTDSPQTSGEGTSNETSNTQGGKKADLIYFASGTPGGVYQMLGTGMMKIINENVSDIELVAVTPAQIAQAPGMLQSGEAMISIGMACMFERAYEGVDEFAGNKHGDLVQVAGMYDNVYGILTQPKSNINDISDITEDTIIGSTATNLITAKALVDAAGKFDPEKIDYRVMSYSQAAEALGDGNIDVTILTAYPYNGTLDSVATTKGVKFLTISEDVRAKFDEKYPKWKTQPVPANTYKDQTEDRYAPTIYTVLYANKNLSDDAIYEMVKTIIENVDDLAAIHPSGQYFTNETTARYLEEGIMDVDRMHPGAVRYFKEAGVIK